MKKRITLPAGGILFFFFLWLFYAATTVSLPSPQTPIQLYSNQTHQDLKLLFLQTLKKANRSIFIAMYGLTDPDVLRLLQKKEQEGLPISILYDPSASGPIPLKNSRLYPILSEGLMHRKIVVIDETLVFLGSANMTPSSLKIHDNLVVGLYHPGLATFLSNPPESHFSLGNRGELFLLPDLTALEKVVECLDRAEKRLRIALFTLTHPLLIDAMIRAHARGVDVRVALDVHTGKGASAKALEKLLSAGVPVYLSQGQQLFHHKWALIDDKKLLIGSANWTQAAFTKNQDCLLVLEELSKKERKFLKNLWQKIETSAQEPVSPNLEVAHCQMAQEPRAARYTQERRGWG